MSRVCLGAEGQLRLVEWLAALHTVAGGFTQAVLPDGRWGTFLASDPELQGVVRAPGVRIRVRGVGGRATHRPTLGWHARRPRLLDVHARGPSLCASGDGLLVWTPQGKSTLVADGSLDGGDDWLDLSRVVAVSMPADRSVLESPFLLAA